MASHLFFILFLFALGACIGSFLNVIVWRLPRNESLTSPRSHCPKCNTPLSWRDNIPIVGWLLLRGRCRYCKEPISPRYPIVEFVTALLFSFYYVMFFVMQIGPCPPQSGALRPFLTIQEHWPIYGLDMLLIAGLLASSLIDAEMFIIPIEIPWLIAMVGVTVHALIDHPSLPGALSVGPVAGSMALGGAVGLVASLVLYKLGWIKQSFAKGEPLLEIDRAALLAEMQQAAREGKELEFESELPPEYTRAQIRSEIGKEMLFLLPPMIGAILATVFHVASPALVARDWVGGLLGSILGALVGAFVVWLTRILGTLGFGRVAMGLGDVHLMFGVGAVIGAGAATIAFFLAPFFGILIAIYMMLTGKKREMPFGPYLSLATAFVLLFYCQIAAYLAPGLEGLMSIVQARLGL